MDVRKEARCVVSSIRTCDRWSHNTWDLWSIIARCRFSRPRVLLITTECTLILSTCSSSEQYLSWEANVSKRENELIFSSSSSQVTPSFTHHGRKHLLMTKRAHIYIYRFIFSSGWTEKLWGKRWRLQWRRFRSKKKESRGWWTGGQQQQ